MRKTMIMFSLFLILCVSLLTSCTRGTDKNSTAKKNIALILRTSYGYHWGTIKTGALAAAKEFNVDINYTAPYNEKNPDEQIRLVEQAIEKRVDAIILGASDPEALADVTERAYDEGIPVIIVDSGVNTDKIKGYITTNNLEAGKQAGNVLVDLVDKNSKVAILGFDRESTDAKLREAGLNSVINKYPGIEVVTREYCNSSSKLANILTKYILEKFPDLEAIVALNEIASEGAAQAVEEMQLGGKVKIVAFNSTTQEIDYLDKGIIQATIIQNPFSIGYLGVKYAVDVINHKKIEKHNYIDSKVITRENMYLPENQKLLFPFIK